MILVDVVCPELGKTVDFQLDENAYGWDIAEEIGEMIARNSGRKFQAGDSRICVYSVARQVQLDLNKSLKENGVSSGEQLIFL